MCTKTGGDSFGENDQRLADDRSDLTDLEIQDGHLKSKGFCVLPMCTLHEVDWPNSSGGNVWKPTNDRCDLRNPEIHDDDMKIESFVAQQ